MRACFFQSGRRADFEKAARQRSLINQKLETTPELKKILPHLETIYGLRLAKKEGEGIPSLSPELYRSSLSMPPGFQRFSRQNNK